MFAERVIPILNVSDLQASFAWFASWGWTKNWEWGTPPDFGAVRAGHFEVYLCVGGQGSRGRGANATTFGEEPVSDKGVWIWIGVDDVEVVYRQCVDAGLDITFPPTNMPWGAREMHVRHPDGHVFRVGSGVDED